MYCAPAVNYAKMEWVAWVGGAAHNFAAPADAGKLLAQRAAEMPLPEPIRLRTCELGEHLERVRELQLALHLRPGKQRGQTAR